MKLRYRSLTLLNCSGLALPMLGAGIAALAVAPAEAQFASSGVELLSQVPGGGNDCWGYVSPSGREYAIKGTSANTIFIEITNPRSPVTLGQVGHSSSSWSDIKTYKQWAYVVNESGGGIQIIDLGNIDNGSVTLVKTVTSPSTSHNVLIDTVSGFLYTVGSRGSGGTTTCWDLADPINPVQVGPASMTTNYSHDAQITTYTSGVYAGKQILFSCSESRGIEIYDVTNKNAPVRLSTASYPSVGYCHQGWLTEDKKYFHVNDELDEINFGLNQRTFIFDVSDLSNPTLVGIYSSGLPSSDHNLYIESDFVFQANYRAGLRVFDSCNPTEPVEVGFFDTDPSGNGSGTSGAWSCYPFFPSGTVLINDTGNGLFMVDPSAAMASGGGLSFEYTGGRPEIIVPAGGTFFDVDIAACIGSVAPATVMLHTDDGSGWVASSMTDLGGGMFRATFPATNCGSTVRFYISGDTSAGKSSVSPLGAPGIAYETFSADGVAVSFHDTFETNTGWTVENLGATSGDWQRGVPVNDPSWAYGPESDSDGSGQCFLTQNEMGNTDVDDGAVRLTSPIIDLTNQGGVTFDYFLNMTNGSGTDRLLVEVNTTGGAGAWTEVSRIEEGGGLAWQTHEIRASDFAAVGVTPTNQSMIRITANDDDPQSIVEGGIDAFKVTRVVCSACPCDCDFDTSTGQGVCDIFDFLAFQNGFVAGDPCACDRNTTTGSGVCDIFDFLDFQNGFVQGCP